MVEGFHRRPDQHIDAIERQSDAMAIVAAGVKDAVTELAVHFDLDPGFAGELDRAAYDSFANYVTSGERVVPADIKMMAYDAVDGLLRERGYVEPQYAQFFLSKLNNALGHPDPAADVEHRTIE